MTKKEMIKLITKIKEKKTILTVDDDKLILVYLDSILKDFYNVLPVKSGDDALNYLSKWTPDMILLDVEMPNMNGYEVIKEIKASPTAKDVPVIFLTSRNDYSSELKALKLGAVDYIHKPFHPELVLARVSTQLELSSLRRNLANLVEKQTNTIIKQNQAIINILAKVTEYRDVDTGGHINRTQDYVKALINCISSSDEDYNIPVSYANNIISAAPLHDIGKVTTPDSILLKPGKLTFEEFEIMKLHTKAGHRLLDESIVDLEDIAMLSVAKDIALAHHERFDGNGYPYGIKGKNIPISARIMAVADVFDALISKRPYKEAYDYATAKEIILGEKGSHFDPVVVDAFSRSFETMIAISRS